MAAWLHGVDDDDGGCSGRKLRSARVLGELRGNIPMSDEAVVVVGVVIKGRL